MNGQSGSQIVVSEGPAEIEIIKITKQSLSNANLLLKKSHDNRCFVIIINNLCIKITCKLRQNELKSGAKNTLGLNISLNYQ